MHILVLARGVLTVLLDSTAASTKQKAEETSEQASHKANQVSNLFVRMAFIVAHEVM